MQCRIDGLVRGSGKIFIKLEINLDPHKFSESETVCLRLQCEDPSGTGLPSLLLPFASMLHENRSDARPFLRLCCSSHRQKLVVIVPQINEVLACDIEATSSQETIDRGSFSIDPDRAKWLSRINYRIRKLLAAQLRDFDQKHPFPSLLLDLEEILTDRTYEYLRGRLRLRCRLPQSLHLKLFDETGRLIPHQTTKLYDEPDAAQNPDQTWRQWGFTSKVHPLNRPFFVAFTDDSGSFLPGFWWIDVSQQQALRERGNNRLLNASIDPGYDQWFRDRRVQDSELRLQRSHDFAYKPQISIVVALYKTPLLYLYEMVESVLAQTYEYWELILVNGSPDDLKLKTTLKWLLTLDKRIRLIELTDNYGIAANTNAGIGEAQGSYIGFLDHDDLLEPDALYEYVRALNEDSTLDILYCDEDLLGSDGLYRQPYFKPDFSIDLLRAKNYICHFLMMRTSLIRRCGGLSSEFDGAQDHELILHGSEFTSSIGHIAKVLYHWRASESSTAASDQAKPYATLAGVAAVQSHLQRLGLEAKVSPYGPPFTYDVRYVVADPQPLVSLVIATSQPPQTLESVIQTLLHQTDYDAYEILLVPGALESQEMDLCLDRLAMQQDRIQVITRPLTCAAENWASLFNNGAQSARGDYLVFLPDTLVPREPDWLQRMVGICQRNDVGAVGAQILYPDHSIASEGLGLLTKEPQAINRLLPCNYASYMMLNILPQERSALPFVAFMVKSSVYHHIGGFNENGDELAASLDFSFSLRDQDLLCVYTPMASFYCYETSAERFSEHPHPYRDEQKLRLRRQSVENPGFDPYYNVLLDQTNPYYRLSR